MYDFDAVINNQFVKGASRLEIINPTTLKPAGTVAALNADEIHQAFDAARKAQPAWEALPLLKRISYLKKWNELISKNRETLAKLMVSEIAKGLNDSLIEVDRTVEYNEYTYEEAIRLQPFAMTGDGYGANNKFGTWYRTAKGVGLAIAPFNYPINLAMAKITPALVMGNTLVFKSPTAGSLSGSYLGKLAIEAGMPAGVFNVVTGRGSEIGDIITQDDQLDFIGFTGSTGVGHHIMDIASTKDVVLEMGGKDPALVLDDNNLDFVANQIITGAYSYQGQRCTAIKRVLTTNAIADKLVPMLKTRIEKLTIGDPMDNVDIAPLINTKAADNVMALIKNAIDKGGKLIIGNERTNNLISPTLVDNVSLDSDLAWVEPFGPVLPIIRIDNVDDMIKVANESEYGLQASIFGQDIDQDITVAKRIKTGTVNINGKSQRGPDSFPFMGIKNSGFGIQGIHETLLSCTNLKGIVVNYKNVTNLK